MKKISRKNGLMTFVCWAEEVKATISGYYSIRIHRCGYCIHNRDDKGVRDCTECYIKKHCGVCVKGRSTFQKWLKARRKKTQALHALKIFDTITQHGKELNYITGVQMKKIAEIDKLREVGK